MNTLVPRQRAYDTYWQFAAERQRIFFKKIAGTKPPYSADPIFQSYKFCNCYRATDRVSQYLIKDVIYSAGRSPQDTLLRIFLFRLFNKIETWQKLEALFGDVNLSTFSAKAYSKALVSFRMQGPIYGNAFILCANKSFGYQAKHDNHLALLESVFRKTDTGKRLEEASSLAELFTKLRELPLIGDFMAYQIAIDFNYSPVFGFDENDFTVAGPGAIRGIRKCFSDIGDYSYSDVIMSMVENQDKEFNRLGLRFQDLFGRPLHAIDCQGLFCETDKYLRAAQPELKSNRKRIKTKYAENPKPIGYFFPPKWGINRFAAGS